MAHILEKTSGQPDDESGRVCKLWMSCSFLGTCELEAVCKLWRLWMWGKRYVPWITFFGFWTQRNSLTWAAIKTWIQGSSQVLGTFRLWFCTSEVATGCKVLAFVNWSGLQAFVGHFWVDISLKSLGTCELKEFASSSVAILNRQQFARYWHLWIGNSLQGIGTCELTTVWKVLAIVGKVLALVSWQQFARYWQL